MGMRHHALLFFGVHLYGVNLHKIQELDEFRGFAWSEIEKFLNAEKPLPELNVYIECLGEGDSGWAVSATIPREIGILDKPLDQFAGDRSTILRVASLITTSESKPTYVGWQVVQGYY